MTIVLVGIVVVCMAIFVALAVARRTPSSDDGVASFRKHLDALSPEARRQVIDRMQPPPTETTRPIDPDDPGVHHGS
ncbi:MAG: hypothetical protein ACO27U_02540 [Ilumatobacteraceae bacterium]|jgi:uncharacterized MAPEG superfamily protein